MAVDGLPLLENISEKIVQKAKSDAGNVGDLKKEMNERVRQSLDEMLGTLFACKLNLANK